MFNNITYYLIFGKPLIMYCGILTFIVLISTATAGAMVLKGKLNFKWHKRLAITLVILALLHGALGVLSFF
jgi:hypothetical protein